MNFFSPSCLIFCCLFAPAFTRAQGMRDTDDTGNAGKTAWNFRQFDFESIEQGKPVSADFVLTNTSAETLILLSVKSGCACTTVKWSDAPVLPGKSTTIRVTHDAEKSGPFYKILTVKTNFDPNREVALTLVGTVGPKKS
jgi:hypothetical protein